jgi:hypothetical protein
MRKVFDQAVNGTNYTFYRTPLFGEIVYNVSILQSGVSTVFIMRKKKDHWVIVKQDGLPDFVYAAESNLHDILDDNERG